MANLITFLKIRMIPLINFLSGLHFSKANAYSSLSTVNLSFEKYEIYSEARFYFRGTLPISEARPYSLDGSYFPSLLDSVPQQKRRIAGEMYVWPFYWKILFSQS